MLTILSVCSNILLIYLLILAHTGRQYFKGMHDEKEKQFFCGTQQTRPGFRRYLLVRQEDVSGVSGTGTVGEIVEFSDGHAALHWTGSRYPWTTPCPDGIDAIRNIHGHGGKTRVVPLDRP